MAAYVEYNRDPYGGHQRMLRLCGQPEVVLDAGGSSGYLSQELAARGAHVILVDIDESAVSEARDAGREAYVVDLSRNLPPLAPSSVDLLICADVLEHLPDPEATLRRLRPLLTPTGRLVASVPNGANWSLRLSLLVGRWQYSDRGLLDRTHLRNFTRRTFLGCLASSGFHVTVTDVTCPVPMRRGGWLSAAAHRIASAFPGLFAYQHIAVAHPMNERRGVEEGRNA